MKRIVRGVVLAVTGSVLAAGLLGPVPAYAITNGVLDGEHNNNVGAILIIHPERGPFQLCSGTLVHERVFLTAGHCTQLLETWLAWEPGTEDVLSPCFPAFSLTMDRIKVSFDSDNIFDDTTWHDVEGLVTHPEFVRFLGAANGHDVGALVLASPVLDPTPATLPTEGLLGELRRQGLLHHGGQSWTRFTVVGYGTTLNWPPPEQTCPDGARRRAESGYLSLNKFWLVVSQNQAVGFGGTGYGDSGGAIFWIDESGNKTLVGITSWGDAPLVAIGLYYRTDIANTLDFIADVISGLP